MARGSCPACLPWKTVAVIQVTRWQCHEGDEKVSNSAYVLNVEPVGFAERGNE